MHQSCHQPPRRPNTAAAAMHQPQRHPTVAAEKVGNGAMNSKKRANVQHPSASSNTLHHDVQTVGRTSLVIQTVGRMPYRLWVVCLYISPFSSYRLWVVCHTDCGSYAYIYFGGSFSTTQQQLRKCAKTFLSLSTLRRELFRRHNNNCANAP